MADNPDPLFYRVPAVSEILDMDGRTIRRGIEAGEIPAVRVGNAIRIPAAWVKEAASA